jgi:hypothetical protein
VAEPLELLGVWEGDCGLAELLEEVEEELLLDDPVELADGLGVAVPPVDEVPVLAAGEMPVLPGWDAAASVAKAATAASAPPAAPTVRRRSRRRARSRPSGEVGLWGAMARSCRGQPCGSITRVAAGRTSGVEGPIVHSAMTAKLDSEQTAFLGETYLGPAAGASCRTMARPTTSTGGVGGPASPSASSRTG